MFLPNWTGKSFRPTSDSALKLGQVRAFRKCSMANIRRARSADLRHLIAVKL
jgi:hypothetical protein